MVCTCVSQDGKARGDLLELEERYIERMKLAKNKVGRLGWLGHGQYRVQHEWITVFVGRKINHCHMHYVFAMHAAGGREEDPGGLGGAEAAAAAGV